MHLHLPILKRLDNWFRRPGRTTDPPTAVPPFGPVDLVSSFESLGNNCEYGIFQRLCSAEPMGLLRFTSSSLASLNDALDHCFEDLFSEADLAFEINEQTGRLICRSARYDFSYPTYVDHQNIDLERFKAQQVTRNAYLRSRLLEQLQSGEKVFIRKGRDSHPGSIGSLVDRLRRFGPNRLLLVMDADHDHLPGSVQQIEEDLVFGYVSRLAPLGDVRLLKFDEWIAVCRSAYTLFSGPTTFAGSRRVSTLGAWAPTATCEVNASGPVSRMVVHQDTTFGQILLAQDLPTNMLQTGFLAVSCWLWVPDAAQVERLELLLEDHSDQQVQPPDLRMRNAWQRIWASTRVSDTAQNVRVSIRVAGLAGSLFFTADTLVEDGCIPSTAPAPTYQPS